MNIIIQILIEGEVIIAKNRHGETGSVELVWLGEIQKFADKSREM